MKLEVRRCVQLSQAEAAAVQKLKLKRESEDCFHYNIDLSSLQLHNESVQHVLCFQEEQLVGYMLIRHEWSQEIEVVVITEKQIGIFDTLEDTLIEYIKTCQFSQLLLVVNQQDKFLLECLQSFNYESTFSEYRMIYDLSQSNIESNAALSGEIVSAQAEDCAWLAELWAIPDQRFVVRKIEQTKLYQIAGESVASVRIEENNGRYFIYALVVKEAYRLQGIATYFLTTMIKQLLEQQAKEIYLEVDATNAPALHLYTKLGFRQIAQYEYYRYLPK